MTPPKGVFILERSGRSHEGTVCLWSRSESPMYLVTRNARRLNSAGVRVTAFATPRPRDVTTALAKEMGAICSISHPNGMMRVIGKGELKTCKTLLEKLTGSPPVVMTDRAFEDRLEEVEATPEATDALVDQFISECIRPSECAPPPKSPEILAYFFATWLLITPHKGALTDRLRPFAAVRRGLARHKEFSLTGKGKCRNIRIRMPGPSHPRF